MMKGRIGIIFLAVLFSLTACQNKRVPEANGKQSLDVKTTKTKPMNSYLSIFEIPATDISRATQFYSEIFTIEIENMEFPGMEMGLFPYQDQMVTGVIVKGEGYVPSSSGVTIYFNAGDDLQLILDKVEVSVGK